MVSLASFAFFFFASHNAVMTGTDRDSMNIIPSQAQSKGNDSSKMFSGTQPSPTTVYKKTARQLTAADTLHLFRSELSAAIQPIYRRTLAVYEDSSYENYQRPEFEKNEEKLKQLSHTEAFRLAKKYPAISDVQVEQAWFDEVNGILGSVGQAMLRNDRHKH